MRQSQVKLALHEMDVDANDLFDTTDEQFRAYLLHRYGPDSYAERVWEMEQSRSIDNSASKR